MTIKFDEEIINSTLISKSPVDNFAQLIFDSLDHRPDDSEIILSHIGNQLERIDLKRLRYVIGGLYQEIERIGLTKNDTVLLASLQGNNELYISLMFLALSSYGVRVFLPMYIENNSLKDWVIKSEASKILISQHEVQSLKNQDTKKKALDKLLEAAKEINIELIDFKEELMLDQLLCDQNKDISQFKEVIEKVKKETHLNQEALIITTSGTSGKSKLVVHTQRSLLSSCLSWDAAGLYDNDLMGGRGFTPLFSHTMGIRAFFNALWTGKPMCLIITDWFMEKPEVVRYLLRSMRPEHITGGPAVFNLFLELIRNFPELNEVAQNSFKCLVGSGAPFDPKFSSRIKKQFGLTPHNAYGTTETQQALNTLLKENVNREGLGFPLPGVKIGLKSFDKENNLFQLFIQAPFVCDHIINDNNSFTEDGYFITGDLVSYDGTNIKYFGRENTDFIKDQFGVKIPVRTVLKYYESLNELTSHIELFSINDTPGLAALLFLDPTTEDVKHSSKELINELKNYISVANNQLLDSIEPFEYNHRSIKRARIVFDHVPRTAKGNTSRYQIKELFSEEIKELTDPLISKDVIINLAEDLEFTDSFTRYNNPYIGQMLHTLGLDFHYHKSFGNYLFTNINGQEQQILDITGGYGTNLLGHNREDLKRTVKEYIDQNNVEISDQGSLQNHPGELAKVLSIKLGELTKRNFKVMFGNSGSEAVEMALHHALFSWKKKFEHLRDDQFQLFGGVCSELVKEIWSSNEQIISSAQCGVIAIRNAFHGNSTGARSMMGNDKKRLLFRNLTNIEPLFINDLSPDWKEVLDNYEKNFTLTLERVEYKDGSLVRAKFEYPGIIASIAEPIIGEGGVRETSLELLEHLSSIPVPLIMDEIQSGLGRSGTFLASQGIRADYYLFGKTIGGNITKLSAVCIDEQEFVKKFGEYYVSTFANGGMATKVGCEVLRIIEEDDIPYRAKQIGDKLKAGFQQVLSDFPDVLSSIKGRGLMIGIYFQNFSKSESLVLRNLYLNDKLGYVFSSYFFHKHHIRIFPTLSAPNVLRIEPSAYLEVHEIEKLLVAFRDICEVVRTKNIYKLLLPLMDNDVFEDRSEIQHDPFPTVLEQVNPNGKKVAFIAHYTHPIEDMKMSIPELSRASDTAIRILFNKMQILLEMNPFLLYSKNIYQGKINFNFIALPVDSAEMERKHRMGKRREINNQIQKAVDMAHELGAEVVSLGAYTSIVTNNGLSIVEPKGTRVITGNTLTVATGVKHLIDVTNKKLPDSSQTIGVIGAGGNIGSAISESLIKSVLNINKLYLIGRNQKKLEKTLVNIKQKTQRTEIIVSLDFEVLKECDVIIIATNTSDPIVFDHHLKSDKMILISDVSVPSAVHENVHKMSNVKYIPFSAFIQLPYDEDFVMSSITPKGTTFCCAAESILCGLEPNDILLKGDIPQDAVTEISHLAEKYEMFNNVHSIKSFKEKSSS